MPVNLTDYGQFLFLSVRHRLIRYAHLWNFIKLSCTVQKSWWFSVKSYDNFYELIRSWRYVPIELCYNAVWRCRFLKTLWPLFTSSIGIYLQPTNQLVKSAITLNYIQDNLMKLHRWTSPIKMRVVGKNEYNCSFSFWIICPLSKLIMDT